MNVNPQIGNLLHHRGHTHTVFLAFFQSLLLFGLMKLFQKRFGTSFFKSEWKLLGFLAFLGPLTHILLDYVNHYGVHPFWPLSSAWHYGDFLFVLEPWLWVTFSVALYFQASHFSGFNKRPSRKLQFTLLSIPLLALFLSWGLGAVPRFMCAVITFWTLLLIPFFYFTSEKIRMGGVWLVLALLLSSFHFGSQETKALVVKNWPNETGFHTSDLILSPLPVNPFCWSVIKVSQNHKEYALQRSLIAPFPKIISLSDCSKLKFFTEGSPPTEELNILKDRPLLLSLSELKDLKTRFCEVRDALQFARAPYFWRENNELFFSDLRFERASRAGRRNRSFAQIKINPLRVPPCPPSRAPWDSPFLMESSTDH